MLTSIMIIDDMETDRYIAKWSIQKKLLASHVLEAKDGQEAIDIFNDYDPSSQELGEKFPPTLILLDINMPRMDGFEFLEKFSEERKKRAEYYESIVVMMFTSSAHERDREKAMAYEFVKDYLVKPLTPEGLEQVLRSHFPSI